MTASLVRKPLLRVLAGEREDVPPLWLMRQAGRYLPEYRALREKASFLELCFDAKSAAEITLQPIRRFGFDAAILFSDILVVPHALGQRVWFVEGEGPRLEPLGDPAAVHSVLQASLDHTVLEPVYETIARVRQDLPPAATLLGFCGAPWTLATYMIAGQGTPDQLPARLFAYRYRADVAEPKQQTSRADRVHQYSNPWRVGTFLA